MDLTETERQIYNLYLDVPRTTKNVVDLYMCYYKRHVKSFPIGTPAEKINSAILKGMYDKKPSFHTIERCARKVREKYPQFRDGLEEQWADKMKKAVKKIDNTKPHQGELFK